MTALRNPKGKTIASRRRMEKITYDFYSDLFDSHVHLPPHHLRDDGHVIPEVLPSEIRHAVMSVRNRAAPGPERIRPEHLKNFPPALINTLARLFTRYLSECKVPTQWRTSKTVLLYKKGDPHASVTIAQSAYCPSSTSSLPRTLHPPNFEINDPNKQQNLDHLPRYRRVADCHCLSTRKKVHRKGHGYN
ncbi:hypothetical protein RB195_004961 [Necator americanus]|uniref:Uncharacterized protein n=1 Tax=Necator americanus TaxID=51031 RepID=A0ABR1BPS7_NECAM